MFNSGLVKAQIVAQSASNACVVASTSLCCYLRVARVRRAAASANARSVRRCVRRRRGLRYTRGSLRECIRYKKFDCQLLSVTFWCWKWSRMDHWLLLRVNCCAETSHWIKTTAVEFLLHCVVFGPRNVAVVRHLCERAVLLHGCEEKMFRKWGITRLLFCCSGPAVSTLPAPNRITMTTTLRHHGNVIAMAALRDDYNGHVNSSPTLWQNYSQCLQSLLQQFKKPLWVSVHSSSLWRDSNEKEFLNWISVVFIQILLYFFPDGSPHEGGDFNTNGLTPRGCLSTSSWLEEVIVHI